MKDIKVEPQIHLNVFDIYAANPSEDGVGYVDSPFSYANLVILGEESKYMATNLKQITPNGYKKPIDKWISPFVNRLYFKFQSIS